MCYASTLRHILCIERPAVVRDKVSRSRVEGCIQQGHTCGYWPLTSVPFAVLGGAAEHWQSWSLCGGGQIALSIQALLLQENTSSGKQTFNVNIWKF